VYGTNNTPAPGQPPVITANASPASTGVFLSGCSNTAGDNQYFTSVSTCTDGITANVAFASHLPPPNPSVPPLHPSAPNTTITLTRVAGTNTWQNLSAITVTPGDGQHAIAIQATQTAGTIGTTTCGTGGRNKPCTTLLGTRQQAFGACNGCGDPDESGP